MTSVPFYSNILTFLRTIRVLIIIALLFDIETGLFSEPCSSSWLLDMPLPCTKSLWRADSESDWTLAYTNYLTTLRRQSTPNYNELLNFEYEKNVLPGGQRGFHEEWLMELDEFGMMAVTTAKYISESGLLHSAYEVLI